MTAEKKEASFKVMMEECSKPSDGNELALSEENKEGRYFESLVKKKKNGGLRQRQEPHVLQDLADCGKEFQLYSVFNRKVLCLKQWMVIIWFQF